MKVTFHDSDSAVPIGESSVISNISNESSGLEVSHLSQTPASDETSDETQVTIADGVDDAFSPELTSRKADDSTHQAESTEMDLALLSSELPTEQDSAASDERPPGRYHKTMGDDAVGSFFKEMARYPLLRADEEVELARQVRFLVEVQEVCDRLTDVEGAPPNRAEIATAMNLSEDDLTEQLRLGELAKRQMVRSNLRLVVSIAKRYLNRGVPFLDLIQEGALGLNRATEKFDPDKGYKFSTYAYWWIRQGITRTIANDSRTIRLPIHIVEKLNKLKKAHRELRRQLHRNPTEAELAEALETTPDQLRSLQQVRRSSLSLNHRVGKGEDTELLELLEDGTTQSPEAQMSDVMMRQEICSVLGEVLNERERDIISLRYGLKTGESHTLEEVGNLFNLSRERVRQIQTKAMRKLRRPQIAARLRGWLR